MNTTYKCKRCNYETNTFKDLVRHHNKQKKCYKNLESYNYSDDQLIVMSLIPYHNNVHEIKNYNIDHLKDSKILYDNLDNYLDTVYSVFKNKVKKCKFCDKNFCKIIDLRTHIIVNCYHKFLIDEKNNNEKNNNENNKNIDINLNGNNNIIGNNNTTNNTINNNITNINQPNIYVQVKSPVHFDDMWDISNIDLKTKFFLVFNNLMYTNLLEELLKNELNLNVIIDKNTNSGIVYKNDIEEYIQMKLKDIVNITMEKLKNQLLDMNEEIKDKVFNEVNEHYRRMINKKYIDYTKDKDIQDNVIEHVSNIFDKKKEDAIKISKSIGY